MLNCYFETESNGILSTTKTTKTCLRSDNEEGCDLSISTWDAVVHRQFLVNDFYDVAVEVIRPELACGRYHKCDSFAVITYAMS